MINMSNKTKQYLVSILVFILILGIITLIVLIPIVTKIIAGLFLGAVSLWTIIFMIEFIRRMIYND